MSLKQRQRQQGHENVHIVVDKLAGDDDELTTTTTEIRSIDEDDDDEEYDDEEEYRSGSAIGSSEISTLSSRSSPEIGYTDNLLKNASSASLAALASLTIPSHKHFSKLIHKHEVPRKVLHVSIGFLTLWLYTIGVSLSQVTPVLTAMLIGIGGCDYIRFKNQHFNQLYCKFVGFLMREKEVDTVNGVVWYLVGLVIVFLLFPKDISLLAVLLLSWADTAASTFGRAYGHLTPKIGNKSLAGATAAFLTGVFSSWLLYQVFIPVWDFNNAPGEILWTPDTSKISFPVLAVVSGLVGAVSEAIDIFDDNLTIPVLSSVFMWCFVKLTQTGEYYSEMFN